VLEDDAAYHVALVEHAGAIQRLMTSRPPSILALQQHLTEILDTIEDAR
jgi:hypothetical protein